MRIASLTAAPIMSSSIPTSSGSTSAASIAIERTLRSPVMTTFTEPPPTDASTVSRLSSSCTFAISACIFCRAFIVLPPGLMAAPLFAWIVGPTAGSVSGSLVVGRLLADEFGAELITQDGLDVPRSRTGGGACGGVTGTCRMSSSSGSTASRDGAGDGGRRASGPHAPAPSWMRSGGVT